MNAFLPGKNISTLVSKKGNKATIRYLKREDLDNLTEYINKISAEDTYINFSGEKISKKEESEFLTNVFKDIKSGDRVVLAVFSNGKPIGVCEVNRDKKGKKRTWHRGVFGITIAKEFRREGIGEALTRKTIKEAAKRIKGLKMIILNVYGKNLKAQNLYKKIGFKECGRLKKGLLYKGKYIDDIKMYKEL